MRKLNHKVISDPVLLFDWVLCVIFGIATVVGIILLFFIEDKQLVMGSTFGLALMSLIYSPLVYKNTFIRIPLTIITLIILAY